MFAEETTAAFREDLRETVYVRRFTGVGPSRPFFDTQSRARVIGYKPEEFVGTIQQGDRKAIVFVPDLVDAGFALPVTSNDKLVVRGKELAIIGVDDNTRREDAQLIALELQVRGQG